MYDKLDYNIESYEYDDLETNIAWDNLICDLTSEILNKFIDADWDKLYEEIPKKSIIWKKRFNDCIPETSKDENRIKALLLLLNTDDPELFSDALSKLDGYDFSDYENSVQLYEKAERMLPKLENEYYKYVIKNFLEKKNSRTR